MRNRTIWAIVFAMAALLLSTSSRAQDLVVGGETIADAATVAAARAEGKLVLYGTYPSDAMASILAAFKADTGIAPDYLRLTSQILFPRVTSEFAAHRLAADYVDLTDPTLVGQLADQKILGAPLKVPGFAAIPEALRDPEGRWYTLIRPVGVIGVNTALVSAADMPKHWTDLLDPKWQGQIGMPSIETGGSAFIPFLFLKQKIAADFWTRLAKQSPRTYPAAAPTEQDLVRGETSLIIGSTSLLNQIRNGGPVSIVLPPEGIPGFPISGGITSSAPHPHAAILFMDWMTSRRGAAAVGETGAYGINPQAAAPHPSGILFPPADEVWNISPAEWASVRKSDIDEWRKDFGK
jgi:iron(III) transport system substrate-binding protein